MNDSVNNPKHYNENPSGVECITVVRHMNFNRGNEADDADPTVMLLMAEMTQHIMTENEAEIQKAELDLIMYGKGCVRISRNDEKLLVNRVVISYT